MQEDLDEDARILALLTQWHVSGDHKALAELTPLVYRELHRLASHYMRREREGHTLQATALVHEVFLRLGRLPQAISDRNHFYGIAARLMRHILLDHAKARATIRRGGRASIEVNSEAAEQIPTMGGLDILEIDEALSKLERQSPDAARAFELHYFGGLTLEETAEVMGVSAATVVRDVRFARAWLLAQMRVDHPTVGADSVGRPHKPQ